MNKCCICGHKASHLVNGLWWCNEHVDFTEGEHKKFPNGTGEAGETELDLAWI